jgi:hypothetical protein
VANGVLARVDTSDGRILVSSEHVMPASARCQGVPLGSGIGFSCGEHGGRTVVYAFRPPVGLEPVLTYPDPRIVAPSGTGALTIQGGCNTAARSAGTYCIVDARGARREIRLGGDERAVRVGALSDGRAVVLSPPRLGAPGSIAVLPASGKGTVVPLRLDALPSDARELAVAGLWLSGPIEIAPAKLAIWVAGSTSFVGLRVGLDGTVEGGTVRHGVDRASLSGAFGLILDPHGGGLETTDGGRTWTEMNVPSGAAAWNAPDGHERGCTPVGCSTGSWVRVGWGPGVGDLIAAPTPPRAKLEHAPIIAWNLDCAPNSESESPADVAESARRSGENLGTPSVHPSRVAPGELDSSAFRPFLGMPSPGRAPLDLGFDFGTEDHAIQLRGYAWGPRGAEWDREGTWQVRVADRFAVRGSIWSTAPSRTPWVDAAAAAEAFGSEPSHRVSSEWRVVLDPVEHAGVLWMRTGVDVSVALVEQGRAIGVLRRPDGVSVDRITSAVKVGGRWYAGSVPGRRSFQILSADAGELSTFGSYPRYSDDSGDDPRVVRSESGDTLGIWVIGHGQQGMEGEGNTWFVYPVDSGTGTAGPPLVIPRAALARPPRACGLDEQGWVLVRDVSPSVAHVEFTDVPRPPSAGHLEARLIAGQSGLCIDALAAQVEGDPPRALRARRAPTSSPKGAPLALTDRATDRRWGFRCTP